MPLNLRASKNLVNFNTSVSFKIYDRSGKFIDARNVNSIQDRLDTRFGTSRLNDTGLGGKVQSVTYFTKSDGSQYVLGKVGSSLYRVFSTGPSETLTSFLAPDSVHRAITWNDRHIIAANSGSLYAYDGSIFTQMGSMPPNLPTLTTIAGGSLITGNKYRVGLTYYASSTGFETNLSGSENDPQTFAEIEVTTPNLTIHVANIPKIPSNLTIDKVYIYLKNVTANTEYVYAGEVNTGSMIADGDVPLTFDITEDSLSSQVPPTKNGMIFGGKYLANFNSKLVVAGDDNFPNEVSFSEPDIPDAFDQTGTQLKLVIPGKGGVTGIGVGLFGDTVLDPFLVITKRKSTRVYSEIGGIPKMNVLSEEIGCVSHDTIQVKNGVVYFLSEEGWRAIINGRFMTNANGEAITLGNGDIDDIFKSNGYVYEVNRNGLAGTFSVYYPTLDQYITWVSEGGNNAYTKAYSYEFDVGGFKPYEFAVNATCATLGENGDGRDVVLFGTNEGYIIKHSIMEEKTDIDAANTPTAINAFAVLPWMPEDADFDATYNYRELILRAVASTNPLTVKTFIDFNLSTGETGDYDFTSDIEGFVLDESILDQDSFGDERGIVTARSDINRVGETIAIGFYQNVIGANMGLVSMQIDSSKNGNRNASNDNGDEEGGFDSETGSYFPSASDSVQQAAAILQQIQSLIGNLGNVAFSGYSARFNEMWDSNGVEDTFSKIIQISYAAPLISLSASPSQSVREKGTVVSSVILSATTSKLSDLITAVTHFRDGVLVDTEGAPLASGGVETYTDSTPFSDTMTFYSKASDGTTLVQSNTITYPFVYPYYYGAGAVGLSAASVAALTKSIISSTASLNRSFTSLAGQVYYFAYPASYGALTSILDENGFETFADWTLTTANITGLDGNAVSYRIYEFNNPVVAGSTDYTFIR